jgi:hypothetical protein
MTLPPKISHRIVLPVLAAVAAALMLAACGSDRPGSTVANLGTTTTTGTAASSGGQPSTPQARFQQALKFSSCMRSHGVPNFPDPQQNSSGGATLAIKAGSGIDPNSSQFQAAQKACRQYAPAGPGGGGPVPAKVRAQALAFSACMRSHGVPNFPDPQFSGGGIRIGGRGIDPSSPQFQAAQKACQSKLPGAPGGGPKQSTSGGSQ